MGQHKYNKKKVIKEVEPMDTFLPVEEKPIEVKKTSSVVFSEVFVRRLYEMCSRNRKDVGFYERR